jgi:prepilin-type N-terminal cleavage/methylation domain-containing protein
MTRGASPKKQDPGFTLVEVLVAMFVITTGLVAVAIGLQYATTGVDTGRRETTATFLAEEKVEQLKAVALVDWTNAALDPGPTTEYCPPAGSGCTGTAATGFYRRVTTITSNPGGTCTETCKLVMVTVFYRPISARGALDEERRVDLFFMLASRT